MTNTLSSSPPRTAPLVIGITGNIASGKSAVVGMLRALGAITIDADEVYHELIRPGKPLWQSLRDHFGSSILAGDQSINRRTLGARVFNDPRALAELDELTHPAVVAEIRQRLTQISDGVVAIDAVKLVESGLDAACDQLWVVVSDGGQQVGRLMARNGLSRSEAEQRLRAQPLLEPKLALADLIIDNRGTLAETRRQVERAWHDLVRPDHA